VGQLGNAKRRMFYGPGIENFDLALEKSVRFSDARSLELRFESFNTFNRAQFYGPAAVDGQIEDKIEDSTLGNYGKIVSAASPRLLQLAAKLRF
jgi:hypothetical protein